VLARVRKETGVELRVLSGEGEARMTFLAVRRWYGWSAGNLLVLDIGGGSLEIGSASTRSPTWPVAATRRRPADPRTTHRRPAPGPGHRGARDYVDDAIDQALKRHDVSGWDRPVATSKTFRTLARLAGAAPSGAGIRAPRVLSRDGLHQVLGFIRHIPAAALAAMDGVDTRRAGQLLAGAIVAEAAMRHFDLDKLDICPWALREGVILRRLDVLES